METLIKLNQQLGNFLWGPATVVLMIGVGLRFTIGTGWLQVRHFNRVLGQTVGSLFIRHGYKVDGVSPFQAMTAALGGTMGTGNVAGIATAIVAGGPGSVFWMWISAFFGMMTKYAEVVLAVYYRERRPGGGWQGGPMTYISKGIGSPLLAGIFSLFCILASFGMGSVTQVNSMAAALQSRFQISPWISGIVAGVVVALIIMGGIDRISVITQAAIPILSLFYMICGGMVLWQNRSALPHAIGLIFYSAFSPKAALGGLGGYTLVQAVKLGVARGVFTNEAGLGSAPIAHAAADTVSPVEQGMWGIFEVFADTIVVCTFTALILLSSESLWSSSLDGAALTAAAFETALGPWGSAVVAISLVFFALAAIVGWAYYGQRGVEYLTGGSAMAVNLFRGTYALVTVLGAALPLEAVWQLADTAGGLMAIPNLIALMALGGVVIRLTKEYFS